MYSNKKIINNNLEKLDEIKKSLSVFCPKDKNSYGDNTLETIWTFSLLIAHINSVKRICQHDSAELLLCSMLPDNYNISNQLKIVAEQLKLDINFFDYVTETVRLSYTSFDNNAVLHIIDQLKENYNSTKKALTHCAEQLETLEQTYK